MYDDLSHIAISHDSHTDHVLLPSAHTPTGTHAGTRVHPTVHNTLRRPSTTHRGAAAAEARAQSHIGGSGFGGAMYTPYTCMAGVRGL